MKSEIGYSFFAIGTVVFILPFFLNTGQGCCLQIFGLGCMLVGAVALASIKDPAGYFLEWDEETLSGKVRISPLTEKPSSYVKVETLDGNKHVVVLFMSVSSDPLAPPIVAEKREYIDGKRVPSADNLTS